MYTLRVRVRELFYNDTKKVLEREREDASWDSSSSMIRRRYNPRRIVFGLFNK